MTTQSTKPLRRLTIAAALTTMTALAIAGCAEPVAPNDAGFPVWEMAVAQLPGAVRDAYTEDAVRLAIRLLEAENSPARNDVKPPATLVNTLLGALARVHAFSHPARDTVVAVHRIHTFPRPATREIMVRVDTALAWSGAWRAGNALTGNPAVDSLVTRHGLTVRQFHYWDVTGPVAVLRSAEPLNAAALATRFAALPGVAWAEPNSVGGDGNDIRVSRHGAGWRLDYSVGWGDCPAGCINRRTWSFAVSGAPGGGVQFLGATGN